MKKASSITLLAMGIGLILLSLLMTNPYLRYPLLLASIILSVIAVIKSFKEKKEKQDKP